MDSFVTIIVGAISIIMIITFFSMSSSLSKIEKMVDVLMKLELNKPENKKQVKCDKCGKEYSVNVLKTGTIKCPECKQKISLT